MKTEILCCICADSVFLRKSKIEESQYDICDPCCKNGRDDLVRNMKSDADIIVMKMHAAVGYTGFDIREPSDEEWLAVRRAQRIRETGVA